MFVRDEAIIVEGSTHDGSAVYRYERVENGWPTKFTLRKNGAWKAKGSRMSSGGNYLSIGDRHEYYDPHF